eukprot:NODE_5_length_72347_cov_1.339331.p26 type:complete len:321 gc:universal NODE_5_length_72347_cov_1.339331:25340-24378(-)
MTFVERNPLVFDCGKYETKFGHAGADLPSFVTSSTLFTDHEQTFTHLFRPSSTSLLKEESLEALLEQSYQYLGLDINEHSLMIPDTPGNDARGDLMETLFEHVPALYFCCRPVLNAFHASKTNALVVDVGHSHTSVCAVHEGYHIKNSLQTSTVAGKSLTEYIFQSLKKEYHYEPYPSVLLQEKPIVESGKLPDPKHRSPLKIDSKLLRHLQDLSIHVFKEHVLTGNAYMPGQQVTGRPFEFPDGFNKLFTKEPYVTDIIFNPSSVYPNTPTLIKMIQASYDSCDNECKNLLPQNIVLTGGTSSIPGFTERLEVKFCNVG